MGSGVVRAGCNVDESEGYRPRVHALRCALGLSVMALVLMLGALLFKWSVDTNRVVGRSMAAVGLVLSGYRSWRPIRSWYDPLGGFDRVTKAASSLLLATGAIGIARSNLPFYFDSAWYGLRPDRVLFGTGGFYEHLGLTTQVHY